MKEKSVPRRQYTEEFKVEAARLAETVGQHEASRRLGVPVATVGNWVRQRQKGDQSAPPPAGSGGPVTFASTPSTTSPCRFRVKARISICDEVSPPGSSTSHSGIAARSSRSASAGSPVDSRTAVISGGRWG